MVEKELGEEDNRAGGVVSWFDEASEGGRGDVVDVGERGGSEGRVSGRRC